MALLVDTNILLRFVNITDAQHELIRSAVLQLASHQDELCYTQQSRREFWNVCTRPAERNGLGLGITATVSRLVDIDALFRRLPDHHQAGFLWDRLVAQHQVKGVQVHDAQLVATALACGITSILTLNTEDFRRYSAEISAVHPSAVTPQVQ